MEQTLAQALQATLAQGQAQRSHAEVTLQALHADPSCGQVLLSLLLDAHAQLHLRQAAALSLNKWIKERWSPYHATFVGFPDPAAAAAPPTQSGQDQPVMGLPPDYKRPLRSALLHAVALPQRPLRLAAANALCSAAAPDWPDDFPELLPFLRQTLVEALHGPDAVHGAMAFLSEFVRADLDESQIMTIARELLAGLERVLGDLSYPYAVRARSVLIFNHFLETLFMVRESFGDVVKAINADVLPRWLGIFEALLQHPLPEALSDVHATSADKDADWAELSLRSQVWSGVKLATHFHSYFRPRAAHFTQIALANLLALQIPFGTRYVAPPDGVPDPPDVAAEGDRDISTTVPDLLCKVIDFLAETTRSDRDRPLRAPTPVSTRHDSALELIIDLLRSSCRMTKSDEDEWLADPSAFVSASEDEEGLGWGLRAACPDLAADLLDMYPAESMVALQKAAQTGHAEGQSQRSAGVAQWWKEHEATLSLLGGVGEAVQETLESPTGSTALRIDSIFEGIVSPTLQEAATAPPFLLGRAFVFASQYAKLLPRQLSAQLLDAAVQAVESESGADDEGGVIVKLSAVRCIKNFHRHLPSEVLRPFAGRIIARLGPLLSIAQGETLVLLIEAIQAVIIDDDSEPAQLGVPPSVYGEIAAATLKVWAETPADVILLSAVDDLLEAAVSQRSSEKSLPVLQRTLTFLAEAIASGAGSESDAPSPLISASVELLHSTLRGAKRDDLAAGRAAETALPPLFRLLLVSDDRDVLGEGVHSLTALMRKVPEQTTQWRSASGESSVHYMTQIVAKLVAPGQDTSEGGGLAVGDLIISMLRKAPQEVQPVLPEMLRALVARLVTAKMASFTQSLILPVAFLLKDRVADVVHLLDFPLDVSGDVGLSEAAASASASGSTHMPALEVLARRWVEHAETFQGFWAQRVSTLALASLLAARVPSLEDVLVKGNQLPDDTNVIRTRSRAKLMPHRYTQIPVPAKLLKLLLHEYTQAKDGGGGGRSGGGASPALDMDDGDGEWDDEDEDEDGENRQARARDRFISDLLGPGGLDSLDDADGGTFGALEDEDLREDAVYTLDMKTWLAKFFAEQAANADAAARLGAHLTNEEAQTLTSALSVAAAAAATAA